MRETIVNNLSKEIIDEMNRVRSTKNLSRKENDAWEIKEFARRGIETINIDFNSLPIKKEIKCIVHYTFDKEKYLLNILPGINSRNIIFMNKLYLYKQKKKVPFKSGSVLLGIFIMTDSYIYLKIPSMNIEIGISHLDSPKYRIVSGNGKSYKNNKILI